MIYTPVKTKSVKKIIERCLIAALFGGLLGLAGQGIVALYSLFLEETLAMTAMILTIIIIASILTGIGIYDKYGERVGAGAFLPISGFANSLTSAAVDGRGEGLIKGIGANFFKLSGCVIIYGTVAGYICAFIHMGWQFIW